MAPVDPRLSADRVLQQSLVEAAQRALTVTETPGATVALLLDGQPLCVSGVGFRDAEQTTALDADAQFYIYSVTKSLIATVVLQLAEQGRVVLDGPVQTYLPDLPLDTPVTVRQLLNHTAGLPDYGSLPAYREALLADPMQPWTDDEFLRRTLSRGLLFAPGRGWSYSNVGFMLLRRVIEAVTGASFRAALHAQIVAPLGLRQTFVAQTLDDARQLTPGYSSFFTADSSVQDIRSLYHPGWVAHGVVVSTAPELARVIDALFAGQLLSPQSRAAMLEPVLVPYQHPLFQQPAYGLGLMIDPRSRYGIVAGHGGGGPGYSAAALHLPDVRGHRITSAIVANRDQDEVALRIAFQLVSIVADMLLDQAEKHT